MSEEQLPEENQEKKPSTDGSPQPEGTPSAVPVDPVSQNPSSSQHTGSNFPPNNSGFPPNNGGFPPNNGGFFGMQQALPNATAVLVLGILSILTCCCYGIVGLILGVVGLILSKKDRAAYAANPTMYTEGSFKNLNAGRVCSIIGLILSILYILLMIIFIMMFGFGVLSDQDALREALQNMQ